MVTDYFPENLFPAEYYPEDYFPETTIVASSEGYWIVPAIGISGGGVAGRSAVSASLTTPPVQWGGTGVRGSSVVGTSTWTIACVTWLGSGSGNYVPFHETVTGTFYITQSVARTFFVTDTLSQTFYL